MTNSIEKSIEQLNKTRQMKRSSSHHLKDNDIEGIEESATSNQQPNSVDNTTKADDNLAGHFVSFKKPTGRSSSKLSIATNKIGEILVAQGKLNDSDVVKIIEYQRKYRLYFGEAALKLKLVANDDILHALSIQFGYSHSLTPVAFPKEIVTAGSPFGMVAEEFRSIRSQLLNNWLSPDQKTLMVVSPESGAGSSYVAANLAVSFSQLNRSTLLIDADMRSPRQHEIFNFPNRVGLSMLLAERVTMADLSSLPYQISGHRDFSVLGCSAIPPNPAELLSKETFKIILSELEKNYDLIILDAPSANYRADISSIASVAKNALIVVKGGQSKI